MDIKKLKKCLGHYNTILDICRDKDMLTGSRVRMLRGEIKDVLIEIEVIERWQRIDAIMQSDNKKSD
jgi:hypothetical protein